MRAGLGVLAALAERGAWNILFDIGGRGSYLRVGRG
jgi:hypothetical protein